MRIQCPCGAKHSLDIAEDTAGPIQFVCPQCGADLSEAVTLLVRPQTPSTVPVGILIDPAAEANPTSRPGSIRARVRVGAPSEASNPPAPALCLKHPGQPIAHQCMICGKGMCTECMRVLGYVCSPHCRAKAEAQGVEIPVYEGQNTVAEARRWRKVGLIAAGVGGLAALLVGVWFWYAWFGSHPKAVYTVHFTQPSWSGQSRTFGKQQLVFLHGLTLARHDLSRKKEVWSRQLIDPTFPTAESEREAVQTTAKGAQDVGNDGLKVSDFGRLFAGSSFRLYLSGTNIWVAQPGKIVRYDWDTGAPMQTVAWSGENGEAELQGNELMWLTDSDSGTSALADLNLITGKTRVEPIANASRSMVVISTGRIEAQGRGRVAAGGGLPVGAPGPDRGQPLDPQRVADEAQSMSMAGRIALPALIAGNLGQQRILDALDEENETRKPASVADDDTLEPSCRLIAGPTGFVSCSVRLREKILVPRQAMKDPPRKSVLDGPVNATQSMELANEMLNESQRARGGATVLEDQSRYFVTIGSPDGKKPEWSGEVIGKPDVFPLQTVNVLAGAKLLIVLDKQNKKIWQTALTHPVSRRRNSLSEGDPRYGQGPCVERGDRLYVFDEAVLTAFDLRTGNAHWRLPSVGITSLFFDGEGMLYVNTTTASAEQLRYSRQIDITQRTEDVIFKIDPKTGKTIWTSQPGGPIAWLSGKFIYTLRHYDNRPRRLWRALKTGENSPPYVKIKRLDPEYGRIKWEYLQQRAPLDVQFNDNTIELVFENEVQVLRFLSF